MGKPMHTTRIAMFFKADIQLKAAGVMWDMGTTNKFIVAQTNMPYNKAFIHLFCLKKGK